MPGLINVNGDTIKGALSGAGDLIGGIRKAITGKDPDAEYKLYQLEAELAKAQIAVNKEEAKHDKMFVSGWRPYIGWMCGGILTFHYILKPLLEWLWLLFGKALTLPAIDVTQIYPILLAMLGFGVMRTYEKYQGINNRH